MTCIAAHGTKGQVTHPGIIIIPLGYFVYPFNLVVESMHEFHFLGIVFAYLVLLQLILGAIWPRETEFVQEDVGAVDHADVVD